MTDGELIEGPCWECSYRIDHPHTAQACRLGILLRFEHLDFNVSRWSPNPAGAYLCPEIEWSKKAFASHK